MTVEAVNATLSMLEQTWQAPDADRVGYPDELTEMAHDLERITGRRRSTRDG